jgi:hypothetical protein
MSHSLGKLKRMIRTSERGSDQDENEDEDGC